MNILLVSQCAKRALPETRRILDQFAERRGDRTWQTPITRQGLDTLRRLLRKTARRNTAVACHWIRGQDHTELLWIVGDASQFNSQGAVPTNYTRRNVLRTHDENDWHTGEDIYLLATLAALLHDLGKASEAFQSRLRTRGRVEPNLYRHEWVSLRLFQAFVGEDDDATWLQRLVNPGPGDEARWLDPARLMCDGISPHAAPPLAHLPALARAIGWLILTHHRLPVVPAFEEGHQRRLGTKTPLPPHGLNDILAQVHARWNEICDDASPTKAAPYWTFSGPLPIATPGWRRLAVRIAKRLLARMASRPTMGWLENPYVMHLSRLSLMLADHHYSSLTNTPEHRSQRASGQPGYPLFANTLRDNGALNQPLDEHLLGVAAHCGLASRALPGFERHLPRLTRHKGLRQRSADLRFRWQDKAADLATGMRARAAVQGAFIVNMASTGCGKTLANARIMYALADPVLGMRCAFALGLRTLTLQTGRAYREALHLGDDDLAIRVGGAAARALFEHGETMAERAGSASMQRLMPDDGYVHFEGNTDAHPLLARTMHDPQARALLSAPLLVCTIDHLVPATDSLRGGGQILPMLRLMSSDLVLDEPDDYGLEDLPALVRLVTWAGLLGSRVLLSSATLPPALVQGLFEAYLAGRTVYQNNRGLAENAGPLQVCCAWTDEFQQLQQDCGDAEGFAPAHARFAQQRYAALANGVVRRRAALLPLTHGQSRQLDVVRAAFARQIRDAACLLHAQHHTQDVHSGKRVSFGLVRMANIESLYDVALALYALGAPNGVRIHLCVYHANYPLLLRSAVERRLDQALDRRKPDAVFGLPDIRRRIDGSTERDHLFIVLGSPVTEVGRDHDYDWGVVEPSSMRSLIQLAGRIRRHREGACTSPNLLVFESNLRHAERPGEPAFCKPGFEDAEYALHSHNLQTLLRVEERDVIDARPRIVARPPSDRQPGSNLVDLEHHRLQQALLAPAAAPALSARRQRASKQPQALPIGAFSWWHLPALDAQLTGALPQYQPFRADDGLRLTLCLLPDDEGDWKLHEVVTEGRHQVHHVLVDAELLVRLDDALVHGQGMAPWGDTDYGQALMQLADELDLSTSACAMRYGTVSLPISAQGWRFHPALGFGRRR